MDDDKNRAITQIIEKVQKYNVGNNNLKIDILNFEWEAFFDILYEFAVMKKLEENYFDILNIIIDNAIINHQYTKDHKFPMYLLSKSNIKRYYTNNCFTLDNILNALWTLHAYKFRNSEIEEIKEEIVFRCSLGEVTDIKCLVKK